MPAGDRHLVWAPLRGVAFVANDAMLSLIGRLTEGDASPDRGPTTRAAHKFLDAIGILEPVAHPRDSGSVTRYLPTCATLFMTTRCSLRCVYCYADAGATAVRAMSPALARRAIDVVAANATELDRRDFAVAFHGGGEPTLNMAAMRAAVKHARAKPLPARISASTNGAWSPAVRRFVLENLDSLSLSFDGLPALQNAQRPLADGRPSHAVVMRNLEAMDAAGFEYGIRMTVTRDSMALLPDAVAYVTERSGPRTLQVEPCFARGRGRGMELEAADADTFVNAFEDAWRVADEHGLRLFYSGARIGRATARFCQATTDALVVMQSGEVTCCFEVHGPGHPLARDLVLGRLDEHGLQVDESRWRSLTTRTSESLEHCRDCLCRYHCQGDCLSRTLGAGAGDEAVPSVRCDINRRITAFLLLKGIERMGGVWLAAEDERGVADVRAS